METKTKRNRVWGVLAGVAVAIVLLFLLFPSGKAKTILGLDEAAQRIAARCPMQVDAYTTLARVEAVAPDTLRYFLVLDLPDYVVQPAWVQLEAAILERMKNDSELAELRGRRAVFSYYYDDVSGKHLHEYVIAAADYEE